MKQVEQAIHTLPLEFDWEGTRRTIHLTAVETESGLILIDTGFPDQADTLISQLENAGFSLDDIDLVIITHQDVDHAGALKSVKTQTDAPVLCHVDDAVYIAGEKSPLKGRKYSFVDVDIQIVDGVNFRTKGGIMKVLATPGHTPGHISLYLPEKRFLIAGDALTAEDTFDGPNPEATPDMKTAIESIGKLADLEIEQTLCFHGGLQEQGTERIQTIYDNLIDKYD